MRLRTANLGTEPPAHLDEPYILFALGILAVPELAEPIAAAFARIDDAGAGHTNGRTVPNFLRSR